MKEKGRHIDIDELFRNRLGASELVPAASVKTDLMKRLARREFIRFNPSRFNIYYLAGLVAAGTAAAFLLFSAPGDKNSDRPSESFNRETDLNSISIDSHAITVTTKPVEQTSGVVGEENKTLKSVRSDNTINTATQVESQNRDQVLPTKDTLVKKEAITEIFPQTDDEHFLQMKVNAGFEPSLYSGCAPLEVRFINRSANASSYRWTFGDGGSSTEINPAWIFDQEGEYPVTLRVYGPDNEESVSVATISVYPKPAAQFEIYPDKPMIPDDFVRFNNYSKDAARYLWEFGDGKTSDAFEPEHKYQRFGRWDVRLIAISAQGCTDTVTMINAFAGSGSYIEFPNAFIPNPDGPSGGYYSNKSDESAQIFHPVTSGVSEYQMRVFSKRGILIFETNDINIGWDGYNKGQLCDPGVYVWKVRGTFRNGESFVRMGDITLLKR